MTYLSNRQLREVHRFALEVHAAGTVDRLRNLVPPGLVRVVGCDHANFNEIDAGLESSRVVPAPKPAWWPLFGEVYQRYMFDHPLWVYAAGSHLNQAIAWGGRFSAAEWAGSDLYHQYFVPLGVRYQLCVVPSRGESRLIGLGLNRSHRSFCGTERTLLEMLSPHVGLAWKNVNILASLQQPAPVPEALPSSIGTGAILVDSERGMIRTMSSSASRLLRSYFGTDAGGSGRLPDDVFRWLKTQEERLCAGCDYSDSPLVKRGVEGRLTVRMGQRLPSEVTLILEEQVDPPLRRPTTELKMTAREFEILHWLQEGKRNREIAVILGISARTVGKHLENLFAKLGVENRTGAVRAGSEILKTHGSTHY